MPMPKLYQIGVVADTVRRSPATIRKWEREGLIGEPSYRAGIEKSVRSYTNAEVLLILKAFRYWIKEHWDEIGSAVPKPKPYRLGQIYWSLEKYLAVDNLNPYDRVLVVPNTYEIPTKVPFNPAMEIFSNKSPVTLYTAITKTCRKLKESPYLIEKEISVRTRHDFCAKAFSVVNAEDLRKLCIEYTKIANGE
jgi:hypothetical protein